MSCEPGLSPTWGTQRQLSLSGRVYVCTLGGVLEAARPASIRWPMAPEPEFPWLLPVDTGHLGPSVDTQGYRVACWVFMRKVQKSN